jgi:uncharacterized protein with ATP-grasp and redox domains
MSSLKPDVLPLPPYLMTSDTGSFARSTIVDRKPILIENIIRENAYPPEILAVLVALRTEIASSPVGVLVEDAPDCDFWNSEQAVFAGKTWLELPWFFAETYFYRRVLEAVRYLQPGAWLGHNPFQVQRESEMQSAFRQFSASFEQFIGKDERATFDALLLAGLWGNRADLSNLGMQFRAHAGLGARQDRHLLLVDDSPCLLAWLSRGLERIDFVNDNTGMELFFDLAMADFLLCAGWARQVTFHLKNRPFFVADAMPEDVHISVDWLQKAPQQETRALGGRLAADLAEGRLRLAADPFWTTCLMLRRLPQPLLDELGKADLVIFKGDVNYRRILDDRHWVYTTPMEQVSAYLPLSFASLRTLKGEMVVGLQPGQGEVLSVEDPAWLINGKRGVIHFINRSAA